MIRLHYADGSGTRLRWTDQHPASHYGGGVVLYPRGAVLDGACFVALVHQRGAWIECGDSREQRRVAAALAWPMLGLAEDRLRLAEAAS